MGNRFSTLTQYHSIILAHGILGALIFLFIVPAAVMTARFYTRSPGWAIKYHAQMQIFSGLLLLAVFMLGFFAVGPERNLSNPHHGIGVAIFVLFILQMVGGRLVRNITKSRSLRITIHQWSGRTIALLGIAQVPLGLTLYGSPKYLFILYAVWMAFLVLTYFILSFRSEGRRELYMAGGRSEAGRTQVTESEYFASDHPTKHGSKMKWLGPLAAGAGVFALMRGRNKDRGRERSRSRSRSYSRSRGPEVIPSRRGSASYLDEKYSDVRPVKKSGGGFMGVVAGAAAAVGAGKLVSGFMNRRDRRDEEYSAVSTETPRRHRPMRGAMTMSEYDSEVTRNVAPDATETSIMPPSATAPAMAAAMSASAPRPGAHRPTTPRPSRPRYGGGVEDSEFSSYVSPSRRQPADRPSGGYGQGILAGLGMGWIAKKFADRKAKKEEQRRLREEEDMRSGTYGSHYTADGYPSPTRRYSQRPPARRPAAAAPSTLLSETTTESSFDMPPPRTTTQVPPSLVPGGAAAAAAVAGSSRAPSKSRHSRSQSRSRHDLESVSMPPMPSDPHGVLHSEAEDTYMSSSGQPQRRASSRRRQAGDAAASAAAARASGLAAEEERSHRSERERFGSPQSQPVSVKLKMHDDKDKKVTLRRLTEEEAMAAARDRADTESSLSGIDSPSNRRRYRRDSSQRRAESAAEQAVDEDQLAPLSPPNPAFAKGRRAKDSAYYSGGQAGPSGSTPMAGQTVSSLGSVGSHGTWSAMSPSPSGPAKAEGSIAADNRRRRRIERRRGSSSRPSGTDMFD